MNRVTIISRCDHCPHFDNLYYSYNETCKLLNRKINQRINHPHSKYDIPDDCPLQKTEKIVNEDTVVDKG